MRLFLTSIFVLALTGCASVITPQRCEQAAAGLRTVDQIAQLLIDHGSDPAKAHKLADAVTAGQMLIAAACAEASPAVSQP